MNNNTFSINVDDKEYKYTILKLLNKNKFNNNYIIYTDGKDTYASKYTIINNDVALEDINTDEEWDYIDSFFNDEGEII